MEQTYLLSMEVADGRVELIGMSPNGAHGRDIDVNEDESRANKNIFSSNHLYSFPPRLLHISLDQIP